MTTIGIISDNIGTIVSDRVSFKEKNESWALPSSADDRALTGAKTGEGSAPTVAGPDHAVGVQVDPRTGDMVVIVYSKEDNRIIREIPPEASRELSIQLDKLTGLLVDRYE